MAGRPQQSPGHRGVEVEESVREDIRQRFLEFLADSDLLFARPEPLDDGGRPSPELGIDALARRSGVPQEVLDRLVRMGLLRTEEPLDDASVHQLRELAAIAVAGGLWVDLCVDRLRIRGVPEERLAQIFVSREHEALARNWQESERVKPQGTRVSRIWWRVLLMTSLASLAMLGLFATKGVSVRTLLIATAALGALFAGAGVGLIHRRIQSDASRRPSA